MLKDALPAGKTVGSIVREDCIDGSSPIIPETKNAERDERFGAEAML